MLKATDSSNAKQIRAFLTEAGYTEQSLRERLGRWELPSGRLHNLARLQYLTQEPDCLNTLIRWFWIGVSVDASIAESCVPAQFATLAKSAGLLRSSEGRLLSEIMLTHVDGLYVASDQPAKIDSAASDTVLWPNPTSRLLMRFTVRRPSRTTLDLGTGCGIQALVAGSHSQRVVATDLNPRATEFAAFNAWLNGIEGIECLTGDGFQPVSGSNFDLIVSNPPFFITPSHRDLFCDNPMDLDFLCQHLLREAPKHLSEGGYLQMVCESAQVRGQSWQERISEWIADTGCDAWILKGQTRDPHQYAQERINERNSLRGEDDDALYADYMAYYLEREVEAIHSGIIAIRRRSGNNWMLMEEITESPKEPFGDIILHAFAARDFLGLPGMDHQILTVKPRLSPHALLEQVYEQVNGAWRKAALTLKVSRGFPLALAVQPLVGEFLGFCDGNRSLGELIANLTSKVDASPEQVQKKCVKLVQTLIARGLMLW